MVVKKIQIILLLAFVHSSLSAVDIVASNQATLKAGLFTLMTTTDVTNTLTFTADITLTNEPLAPIYLANTGNTLEIIGDGHTLNGADTFRGFFLREVMLIFMILV